MKNQFVTYEIALKLKELEFDEPCLAWYDVNKEFHLLDTNVFPDGGINQKNVYPRAPLWQQVWSFLDSKGVIISIIFVNDVFKYTLNIENYCSNGFKDRASAIRSATEYATSYLWNKEFNSNRIMQKKRN